MSFQPRRKRINNCLDQLRALLPFTTTMKRDMASLLEQTVEYINTMHTVLNEDKPACLSKVYTIYQRKVEENEFFRKGTSKLGKRKHSGASGSCSYVAVSQQQPPQAFQGYHGYMGTIGDQIIIDAEGKRHCPGVLYDQNAVHQGMSTPTGSNTPNWPSQQQLIEQNMSNNNNLPNSYMTYGSEGRGGILNPNRYIFGQSPLASQYTPASKQSDQVSPYTSRFIPPYPKIGGGIPKPVVHCPATPPMDAGLGIQHPDMSGQSSQNDESKNTLMEDMITKARKAQGFFNVSNLVSNNDQRSEPSCAIMQASNQSPWQPQDYTPGTSFNHLMRQPENNGFIAPIDMSASPSPDCPQYLRATNKLLNRDRSDYSGSSKDVCVTLKGSSVSNMLSEVTGIATTDYSTRSFGSTEPTVVKQQITPIFSSAKWQSPVPVSPLSMTSTMSDRMTTTRSCSAPAEISCITTTAHNPNMFFTSSSPTEKTKANEVINMRVTVKTEPNGEKQVELVPTSPSLQICHNVTPPTNSSTPDAGKKLDVNNNKPRNETDDRVCTAQSNNAADITECEMEKMKEDVNNNPATEQKSNSSSEMILVVSTDNESPIPE